MLQDGPASDEQQPIDHLQLLEELNNLAREIVSFLNVPQIGSQEG